MTLFYFRHISRRLTYAVFFLILTTFFGQSAFGQVITPAPVYGSPNKPRPRDTLFQNRHFGRAAAMLGIAEVAPYSYDRFIRNVDYSHISFHDEWSHLNPGSWQIDNDPFGENQIAHPYHGSQFYSAFRANGFNFWQSSAAAFTGSYIWETFAENQRPAPNDFINTGFGGTVLGEMTFRLSNRIVNNRSRGFKRQLSEVFGLLVNPMNGATRILDGKWGRVYGNTKERDSSVISAVFDLGGRSIRGNNNTTGLYGRARLSYGTAYENYKVPFSNIYVDAEFGKDDTSAINVVSVYGSLVGWRIRNDANVQQIGVISANYDYIHNQQFFYGAQSVKFNFISNFKLSPVVKINTNVAAGPVLLAAVPDQYLYRGRNYGYGSGGAVSGTLGISIADKLMYNIAYRGGYIKTISGNADHYLLHGVTSELSYMFVKNIAIAFEPGVYRLNDRYESTKFADVSSRYTYYRASIRYTVPSL